MLQPITLTTPLPAADLRIESFDLAAGLSMLDAMKLGLLSDKPNLKPEDLLGKIVTVNVAVRDGATRHFCGHVTRFGIGQHRGRFYGYHATVRPWLWFLKRTSDCRIFQDQSVPDIVRQVFEDHGVAKFEFKLFRSYRKWVYCVQYRESDYNFVARLLAHEGIYWYFEHGDGQHKLILVDSQSAHDAAPGTETLPYFPNEDQAPPNIEYVSSWAFAREVETGKMALRSYDFERPSTALEVSHARQRNNDLSDYEAFDYQGDYVVAGDGTQLAEDRVDELQSRFEQLQGTSNSPCIDLISEKPQHP